jgi:hypothetical protein
MDKMNREIDNQRMEISKSKTIDSVMDRINNERSVWDFLKVFKAKFAMVFMAVALLVVVVIATNPNEPYQPITLSQVQTQKLVETSYMSASIISNAVVNSTATALSFIDLEDNVTEFEKNIDEFNYYFNMLKVFIDNSDFTANASIEELIDQDYQYKISYLVDNKEYVFYLNFDESGNIDGEINIGSNKMLVEGKFEEKDDEFELELTARKNNDYIIIEYKSETSDEIETKYLIKQNINSIYIEKEINIEFEDDEVKVEIKQGEDQFLLEKYSENGSVVYFMEYEVNNFEGEVYITESIDEFGKTIYSYHITEGDFEKDIDLEDPDDDDEDEEDEEDVEDEEDEEDEELEEDDEDEDDLTLVLSNDVYNL